MEDKKKSHTSRREILCTGAVLAAGCSIFSARRLLAQAAVVGKRPLPAVTPAVNTLFTVNIPQHSPDQLDFGTVANGSTSRKTFSLTTLASGYVTLSLPAGAFRVAEFREIAPLQGGSKNGGAHPAADAGSIRSRIKYQQGQNGPFQWSMAPNMEIQVDLVFAPILKRGETPGPRSATMKVGGPGPRGNWSLAIPLTGVLSNLVVTPAPPATQPANQSASSSKMPSAKNAGAQQKREEH